MKPLESMGRYATVVIDPPWHMDPVGLTDAIRGRTVSNYDPTARYNTLKVSELAEFPVPTVLLDDSFVFCWTANKYLSDTFDLLTAWGCTYSYTMSWIKSNGPQYPGGPMFNTEWCLVGRRGKPKLRDTKSFATGNFWPWVGHSIKPEGFYDLLRRVTVGPRLDIFGRRAIAGFDSWGTEAPEGQSPSEHFQTVLDLETQPHGRVILE